MSALDPISAAVNLRSAQQVGKVQLSAAARVLKIANGQGEAALALIESAAQSITTATADLSKSLGGMVDIQA